MCLIFFDNGAEQIEYGRSQVSTHNRKQGSFCEKIKEAELKWKQMINKNRHNSASEITIKKISKKPEVIEDIRIQKVLKIETNNFLQMREVWLI